MSVYADYSPNYTSGNLGVQYLFPHITEGGFAGSVATLKNPSRQASAHYVIENETVAQLVLESDTAWHCGNWWYNQRSISYELVGTTANPPSKATLDTCAGMMAEASRKYFDGAKLVLGENVMLHKMVSATSCPGTTDISYLIAKANEILGQGGEAPAPEPVEPPMDNNEYEEETGGDFQGGTYRCNCDVLNVRDNPSLYGDVMAQYHYGETVVLDSWCVVNGGYVWGRYTAYSGATRYVAVGKATGKPESNDFLVLVGGEASTPSYEPVDHIQARTYTCQVNGLRVRDTPSLSGGTVASYNVGETVALDGWETEADGYIWGRYTSYSGATRYVAVKSVDGATYLS